MIKKLCINNIEFLVVIEQLRLLNSIEEIEIIPNNYFGYFKLSEITPLNYGECFRDENRDIIFFSSPEQLITHAHTYLSERYK